MMLVLLDSALRSLLFGLLVWATLKLLRMRDTGTETIIWTAVLVVALSMPLLNHYLPRLVVAVPRITVAPRQSLTALRLAGPDDSSITLLWLARYGQTCLLEAYALGLVVCLTRLALGWLLTLRLYLRAVPVEADWAKGRHVRTNAALKSPASLARTILVPADYADWSAAKRAAVLAHEEAHIARGDFFVQLAASIHCALFWFSPFAWWLQSKLAEIAETASDEAAIQRLNDRVTYAEILLQVARRAQPSPSIVAMAKGPFIQQRVERILSEARSQNPSPPLRVFVIGSLTLAAFALAGAKAASRSDPVAHADNGLAREGNGKTPSSSQAPSQPLAHGATRRGTTSSVQRSTPPRLAASSQSSDDETLLQSKSAAGSCVHATPARMSQHQPSFMPARTFTYVQPKGLSPKSPRRTG